MSTRKSGVTYQKNNDGSSNPKYVDLLEEDKPVSGQKFVCVSFVSPENILVQKNHFLFQEFLKHYDFSKSTEKFTQFLNFIAYKHNMEFDDLMKHHELKEVYFKEHPANTHYDGIEESRDWMFEVKGYHPSFFSFWKKCKKQLDY